VGTIERCDWASRAEGELVDPELLFSLGSSLNIVYSIGVSLSFIITHVAIV
jgi:hypothetical protein